MKITKNSYKVMCVNWASSMTDMDIVNAAVKQKGEEEGGVDEIEGGQNCEYVSPHISHRMALQGVDDY
jgi:hypothetical protein